MSENAEDREMSSVTTIIATVAATAGAVALYRFADRKSREFRNLLAEMKNKAAEKRPAKVLDFERDPDSGVFRPKH